RSWCVPVQRGGVQHRVRADVALGDEPAPATKTVIPAFALRPGLVARPGSDLAAVPELGHVAWAAGGTGEQERDAHLLHACHRAPTCSRDHVRPITACSTAPEGSVEPDDLRVRTARPACPGLLGDSCLSDKQQKCT